MGPSGPDQFSQEVDYLGKSFQVIERARPQPAPMGRSEQQRCPAFQILGAGGVRPLTALGP
jgi:hypothetical protein